MITGQAVELLFDKESEDRITEVWSTIGEGIDPHRSVRRLKGIAAKS
jgi:hypothetical protein